MSKSYRVTTKESQDEESADLVCYFAKMSGRVHLCTTGANKARLYRVYFHSTEGAEYLGFDYCEVHTEAAKLHTNYRGNSPHRTAKGTILDVV